MKQCKQIIKDIIASLILSSIFFITLLDLLELKKSYFGFMKNEIIYWIFIFISFFMIIGLFFYICFAITKGTEFIYKDPNKEKNLNNIYFGQLFLFLNIPRESYCNDKLINCRKELYSEKNYFLRKWYLLSSLIIILFIITHILVPFFYRPIDKDKIEIYYNYCDRMSLKFSFIIYLLVNIYEFAEKFDIFWCYYVKLFQLLGIFRFSESNFNKIINYHNYFLISTWYYEKLKSQTKKIKSIKKD
ncbi:MAG: hypothetical protein ACLTFB_02485 [Candidatus Phytoplasma pyri]